ncbi:MAG: NAD binding domain of 6-phosphogluconate dehydrogenase-domain-containing protein [Benniella sp.]|nr:MAG: NAD binding domain of 6-phosphogluconate dehydrogenase-domain-containing protein [Benniella sp.]
MNNLIHLKQQDRIGWIGLGEMGYSMANNLHRYLASIHLNMIVWNRDPAKSAKMHSHGAKVAKSIEDLVAQSNIIFTSLANDEAVEEIYTQLIDLAGQVNHRIIFVETSTIYPALATKLSEQVSAHPQQHIYLQCPVFGRPPVAKAAKLIWVTSGDEKAIKKMCLYFTTMSKSIIHLKTTNVAKACQFKLLGNFFVVGTMELLAEGLTLAEKAQVDQESVLKFVESFFPAPAWIEYSRKMVQGDVSHTDSGFSVALGLKDVGHMRQLALEHGASLPTADTAYNHLKAVQDQGQGEQDWSSLINSVRSAAKLPPVTAEPAPPVKSEKEQLKGK